MKRFSPLVLAAGLLTAAMPGFAANGNNNIAITPAERAKIETVVHEYLIKNPQVLIEVMQILQKKQADQTQQIVKNTQKAAPAFAKALFHTSADPVIGNPNGKVTLVEFFDYQCPHCVDMAPVIISVVKANPDLRVVFKEFPIRGPLSEYASRAALAANLQGKYEVFSHALLTSTPPLTEALIIDTAKKSGVDVDKMKKDMDSDQIKNQVKENVKLAQDLKLFGTPALFVGKTGASGKEPINYIPGQADQAQLQGMIDQANQ